MNIRTIIVDDEPHAIEALTHLLKHFTNMEVVARCANGVEAIKAVHEHKPEVLFLDIHMPKLDGFDVLDLLGDEAPLIVFITAYDEYAVKAFESNALDYLLKPVSQERLEKSIERITERLSLQSETTSESQQQALTDHQQNNAPLSRVLVRDKGDVHVVPVNDIVAIEAADDYVVIHTLTENHIKQERLNKLESLLNPQQFCRIHRSSIINLDYLEGIESEGKDTRFANMKSNKQFAISRSGYGRLVKLL